MSSRRSARSSHRTSTNGESQKEQCLNETDQRPTLAASGVERYERTGPGGIRAGRRPGGGSRRRVHARPQRNREQRVHQNRLHRQQQRSLEPCYNWVMTPRREFLKAATVMAFLPFS